MTRSDVFWDKSDTLERRQGLRLAFTNWIAEGKRLQYLAPLDFAEAIAELHDDDRPRLPSVHRQST
jgi:hypothetical protein